MGVFVGDAGTEVILDCGVNISTATALSIVARKPNGVKVTWPAILDSATAIKYATLPGDLDVAGLWQLQSAIEMPGWKGKGGVATLKVSSAL